MPETYIEFKGSLLRLSDDRLADYVADVDIVRAIYESEGLGMGALRQHADDLRGISADLEVRLLDGEINSVNLWKSVIGLALDGREEGRPFIDAHAYIRTNRLIDAEFGPDETETTQILRDLALGKIACSTEDRPKRDVIDFYERRFSAELMDVFWGADGSKPNKMIKERLFEAEKRGEVNDPALARVVSTLIAKSCDVVYEIDDDFRVEILSANRAIFADKGMFLKGAKEVPSLLVDSKAEKTEEIEESEEQIEDVEENNDEFLYGIEVELNRLDANCRVDRKDFRSRRSYEKMRNYIVSIMFPNRGEDIKAAKELCDNCFIREDCLEYALQKNLHHGIWGGESERSRRRMRTARKQQQEQLQALFNFMAFGCSPEDS